mgnify:CR=1 FL=1
MVVFERLGWTAEDYDRWADSLLTDQTALVTSTRWEGRIVGRLAFLHPHTSTELVEEVLGRMA